MAGSLDPGVRFLVGAVQHTVYDLPGHAGLCDDSSKLNKKQPVAHASASTIRRQHADTYHFSHSKGDG